MDRRDGHSRQAECSRLAVAELVCERLIGTIRRKCLDHMIVFGGRSSAPDRGRVCHLLYNESRTHPALNQHALSIGRSSTSAPSHHDRFSLALITDVAETS
jgi:hypothetical protein